MTYTRDPVSVHFDEAARHQLSRARAASGWITTRLADPTPRQIRRWQMSDRIDVTAADPVRRGLNARTRWGRAFVRSLYAQLRETDGPLRVEIGRRVPELGVLPAGRQVRIRLDSGARAALAAVRRLPGSQRIYLEDGSEGGAHADNDDRDWDWNTE